MQFSEEHGEIAKAFAQAWGQIETPKHNRKVDVKNKEGRFLYSFNYTDLAGILDTIRKPFKEAGLLVTQNVYTATPEGTNMNRIHVETMIMHSSGQYLIGGKLTFPAHSDMQSLGGQITYLKRYSLASVLGLATEEDDDGNGAAGNFTEPQGSNKPQQGTQGNKGRQGTNTNKSNSNAGKGQQNQNKGQSRPQGNNNPPPVDDHVQPFPDEQAPPKPTVQGMTVGQKTQINIKIAAIAKDYGVPQNEVYPRFKQLYDMVAGKEVMPKSVEDITAKTTADKIIKKLDEHLASKQDNAGLPELKMEPKPIEG